VASDRLDEEISRALSRPSFPTAKEREGASSRARIVSTNFKRARLFLPLDSSFNYFEIANDGLRLRRSRPSFAFPASFRGNQDVSSLIEHASASNASCHSPPPPPVSCHSLSILVSTDDRRFRRSDASNRIALRLCERADSGRFKISAAACLGVRGNETREIFLLGMFNVPRERKGRNPCTGYTAPCIVIKTIARGSGWFYGYL